MNRKSDPNKSNSNKGRPKKFGADIVVRGLNQRATRGWLTIGWQRVPCAGGILVRPRAMAGPPLGYGNSGRFTIVPRARPLGLGLQDCANR
jgi:hypothetical protein